MRASRPRSPPTPRRTAPPLETGAPQHEIAFQKGEQSEIAVAETLEKAVFEVDGLVLHNRRMGGHDDIDHIAVVPSGVYVVDT